MKLFIVSVLAAVAAAKPSGVLSPLVYSTPLAVGAPVVVSAPVSTQYHSQDELGQYSYGYSNAQSAKSEARSANGVTVGGYSYVDAAGKLQAVEYSSDANGFRVAASNLPLPPVVPAAPALPIPVPVQDTPEVVEARSKHLEAFEAIKARTAEILAAAPVLAPVVAVTPSPLIAAPLAPVAAPLIAAKSSVEVPAVVTLSSEAPSGEPSTTTAPVDTTSQASGSAVEAKSAITASAGTPTLTPAGVSLLSTPAFGVRSLVAPALPVAVASVVPAVYSVNSVYPYGFSSIVAQPAVSTYTAQYVSSVPGSVVQSGQTWSPANKNEQSSA